MAGLKFAKSAKANGAGQSGETDTPKKTGFLKKGAAAKELFESAEAAAELKKQEAGKMFRFSVPEGEERKITFLDGDLNEDGMIDCVTFYEHTIQHNGKWDNFVCTADDEDGTECPICKEGKYPNYFAAALTVLNHTPHKIKNGPNAGKIIKNSKMLFVMKLTTYKQLSKLAVKRGGLAGTTWDASRTKDTDPRVGGQFDFIEKIEDGEELMSKYDLKLEDLMPADYEKEIVWHSPDELVAAGIGEPVGPAKAKVGGEKALTDKDFSSEL